MNEDECMEHSTRSFPPPSPTLESCDYSSFTGETVSMRSASPALSVRSVTSSLRAQTFKYEYGRGLNNYSEVYRLPADDEELERLAKQHRLFIECAGRKYVPPMEEVMMEDSTGERKACLDLGCGSGCWIIDVAIDFPHCAAVGVDLIPIRYMSLPQNLRSEVDDINLKLEHFYGEFNVVHARLISSGIKDYAGLVDQISMILRPGGLIDLGEFDFHIYDHNHRRVEVSTDEPGPPWLPRWYALLGSGVSLCGGSPDAASFMFNWVSNHPAFEGTVATDYWLPVSPFLQGDWYHERIGKGMMDDIREFIKSCRPLLLGTGLPENFINILEQEARNELDLNQFPYYIRFQTVYARKRL